MNIDTRVPMPQRFGTLPTINGYEVVDMATGRSLGFERPTRNSANGIAQSLNRAALSGSRELSRALGAAA